MASPRAIADSAAAHHEPVLLQYAVLAYLALLPIGHLLYTPIGGVWMTGADLLLGLLILAGGSALLRERLGLAGRTPDPGRRAATLPVAMVLVFALWVAVSGVWGYHPQYALLKALGFAALGLGVLSIAESRVNWRIAVDAWLVGTALAILVTWIPAAFGPEIIRERVAYLGGNVDGLPFPRVRGPMIHPNMFGDYLVVSGALLWTRWEAWKEWNGVAAFLLAVATAFTLIMTVSSAWVAAGVVMPFIGLCHVRRRDGHFVTLRRPLPFTAVFLGVALAAVAGASLLASMEFEIGPLTVGTGGIRPEIWASAVEAVRQAPVIGVGAAPFLAEVADPLHPGSAPQLWDAHNMYLSILAQFGGVGLILLTLPVAMVLRHLLRAGVSSVRIGLLLAILAVAVHGIFQASEELRHFWALLGIALLVTHREAMLADEPRAEPRPGQPRASSR